MPSPARKPYWSAPIPWREVDPKPPPDVVRGLVAAGVLRLLGTTHYAVLVPPWWRGRGRPDA